MKYSQYRAIDILQLVIVYSNVVKMKDGTGLEMTSPVWNPQKNPNACNEYDDPLPRMHRQHLTLNGKNCKENEQDDWTK